MNQKIFGILIYLLLCGTNCFAGAYNSWNQDVEDSGYDWVIHSSVGAVTSAATIYYTPDDWNPWLKYGSGIVASLVVGGVIESFDKNWDNQDWLEYGYGGVGGAVIMWSWDIDWLKK